MTAAGPLDISVQDDPAPAALAAVDAGLDAHNSAAAPVADVRALAAFASDASGVIVGGAVGRTWGGCCELQQLWVADEARGAGVGSRLLRSFEARARTRGCRVFYLTTLSYQAPDFYRRHGYETIARIDGYPEGIAKFHMRRIDGDGAG